MDPKRFHELSRIALRHLDDQLGEIDNDDLDIELAEDVLTLSFDSGGAFIINAHSAALQMWLAAGHHAWHFDYNEDSNSWIAAKNGDELMSTVKRVLTEKLGQTVEI